VLDGRYNIDNNGAENGIRTLAIGRKNYMFCGNNESAGRTAVIYSLQEIVRARSRTYGVETTNKKRRTPVNPRVRFIIVTSLKTSLKTKEIHLNGANVVFPN
jgi:hypothetical protein